MPSALRISTESGTEYLLPPDGSTPIELDKNLYINLIHQGYFHLGVGEGYLTDFIGNYINQPHPCGNDLDCYTFRPNYASLKTRLDEAGNDVRFLFSPTSAALALWTDTTLEIRTHHEIVAQVTLEPTPFSHPDYAAWSPDGRYLAYSDRQGLWLWDVFDTERQPQLLLPSANNTIPLARHFSPLGRYLSIETEDGIVYLNLNGGENLADGILSLDESTLIAFDTQATEPTTFTRCSVQPLTCREPEWFQFWVIR